MLKSTKFQVPDLNTMTQATPGPQVAIPLSAEIATIARDRDTKIITLPHQVEIFTTPHDSVKLPPSHLSVLTMHEKSEYDCILADCHSFEENSDDDTHLPHQNHFLILLFLKLLVVSSPLMRLLLTGRFFAKCIFTLTASLPPRAILFSL